MNLVATVRGPFRSNLDYFEGPRNQTVARVATIDSSKRPAIVKNGSTLPRHCGLGGSSCETAPASRCTRRARSTFKNRTNDRSGSTLGPPKVLGEEVVSRVRPALHSSREFPCLQSTIRRPFGRWFVPPPPRCEIGRRLQTQGHRLNTRETFTTRADDRFMEVKRTRNRSLRPGEESDPRSIIARGDSVDGFLIETVGGSRRDCGAYLGLLKALTENFGILS